MGAELYFAPVVAMQEIVSVVFRDLMTQELFHIFAYNMGRDDLALFCFFD